MAEIQAGGPVAILMATYNGARHLPQQLDSLAAQTLPPQWLIVGDDGSTDSTRDCLEAFAQAPEAPQVTVVEGPRRGAARNFTDLLAHVPPGAAMVGFCDQDDVWLPEKIARAWAAVDGHEGPVLYSSATWVCDDALEGRRMSRRPDCPPSFRHALVQNIAGGNTMMMNYAAACLLAHAARGLEKVVVHDWWAYQIVTGAGGTVMFDREPTLLYRQHGANQIGANDGFRAKLLRLGMLLSGHFREWNEVNIAALRQASPLLTADARAVLEDFAALRTASLPRRLSLLRQTGLYRQDVVGNASLWLAALLGRL